MFSDQTEAEGLRGAERINGNHFVTQVSQTANDVCSSFAFNAQFIGNPLMMKTRLLERFVKRHLEIDDVNDGQQGLADDGGPAGGADGENGFTIF